MEDTIVSFEVAKLAKDKGFTDVVGVFRGKHYYNYKGGLDADQMDYLKAYVRQEDTSLMEAIAAPTQSLLRKWLREKHSLYILLEETETLSLDSGIGFYYKIIKVKDKEHLRLDYSMYFYKTYEEALEVGLKEGLRLI